MFNKILLLVSFMSFHLFFYFEYNSASQIFYYSNLIVPQVLFIYFYLNKDCNSIKYLFLMLTFNWLAWNIIFLFFTSKLEFLFVALHLNFIGSLSLFIFYQKLFSEYCPCLFFKPKEYCIDIWFIITLSFLFGLEYAYTHWIPLNF